MFECLYTKSPVHESKKSDFLEIFPPCLIFLLLLQLRNITDRMVRSCDFNVNEFLRDIDSNLEASRNVFRDFDARFHQITDDEWDQIQLKVSYHLLTKYTDNI